MERGDGAHGGRTMSGASYNEVMKDTCSKEKL